MDYWIKSVSRKEIEYVSFAINECWILSKIKHPNIVNVIDIICDDSITIKMEKYTSNHKIGEASLRKLIDVLAYLEEVGVVHGDISVDNIMFDNHGNPVVIDFDTAFVGRKMESRHKPQYVSPEESSIVKDPFCDAKSDVYALAIATLIYDNLDNMKSHLHRDCMISIEDARRIAMMRPDKDILLDMLQPWEKRLSAVELRKKYNIDMARTNVSSLFHQVDLSDLLDKINMENNDINKIAILYF